MWTLFKREITDMWGVVPAIFLFTFSPILIAEFTPHSVMNKMVFPIFGYSILSIFMLAVGAGRMVVDRTHGISTFFAGHLVTREQLFTIRLLIGILFILLFYIPILCWLGWREWLLFHETTSHLFVVPIRTWTVTAMLLFLFPLSCYTLGLQMGQVCKRNIQQFIPIVLLILLFSFAAIKGLGTNALVILALLNLSLIYSTWRGYTTAAL